MFILGSRKEIKVVGNRDWVFIFDFLRWVENIFLKLLFGELEFGGFVFWFLLLFFR